MRLEAQNYAQSACSKDNSAFAVACMSDVYGAGGWLASQIVPRIKKNRFKVPGDGKYVKSFVHIDDAVAILVQSAWIQKRESIFWQIQSL